MDQPRPFIQTDSRLPNVVIVGGGFGGLAAAKTLAQKRVDVTLVDRNNYHLFQPLLYQVATGTLSPANIARPIRNILKRARNVQVLMDEVVRIDLEQKAVIGRELRIPYDYLIVATGARHSYFGHPEWESVAPGLKDLPDAVELRNRVLRAFEAAEKMPPSPDRVATLTFVIIGAGPTGLELAGAIAEMARYSLRHDFRNIDPTDARILLIEGDGRVVSQLGDELAAKAKEQIEELGVEVWLNTRASAITPEGVQAGDKFVPARTIIWAAGNQASPLGKESHLPVDRAGRVLVGPDLTVPGHPEVQVVGDLANFSHQGGQPLPGVSPVAIQQGRHSARNVLAMVQGEKPAPFHYFDKGSMAVIGRSRGVADIKGVRFGGTLAWYAWLFVHLIFLIGFRNRLIVLFEWFWSYVTWARDARLIAQYDKGPETRPD